MTVTIERLEARLLRVPLRRPWGDAVRSVGVVATTLQRSDGVVGHGLAWTPQIGAEAVLALLRHDLAPVLAGRPAEPGEPWSAEWDALWAHLHEAGGGGLTTIALAGVDLAVWDAAARASARPVSDLLGRRREHLRAYGSGVNLHYSIEQLVAQAERWVAAGFDAVKVKVGKPDLAEDVERMRAVRAAIGPDRALMIDANQRWDLDLATTAMAALEEVRPAWIEEPLRAERMRDNAALARRIGTPVAVGENLHSLERFAEYLDAAAAAIVQPNVVRVGGITPFLRIAALAREAGAALHPHLLPELSGQVALTLEGEPMVEDVEEAGFGQLGALLDPSPVVIRDGRLAETPHEGLGLRFAEHLPDVTDR